MSAFPSLLFPPSSQHYDKDTARSVTTTSGRQQQQRVALSDTSSLVFFVHKLKLKRSSGKSAAKNFAYHMRIDVDAAAGTLFFRTVSKDVAANLSPPEHIAAVSKARASAEQKNGEAVEDVVGLEGFLTIDPRLFGCCQVTLDVSLTIPTGDLSPPTSPNIGKIKSSAALVLGSSPSISSSASILGRAKSSASSGAKHSAVASRILAAFATTMIPALHQRLARYEAVDEAALKHFEEVVIPKAPPTAAHENELLLNCLTIDDSQDFGRIPNTIRDSVSYFQKSVGGSSALGKSVARIDASAPRVVSYLTNSMSYERIFEHVKKNGNLMRKEIVIPSSHSKIMMTVQKFPGAIDNRLFSIVWTWRREPDGSFTIAFADTKEGDAFGTPKTEADDILRTEKDAVAAVLASTKGFWRVKPLADNVCETTLVQTASFGGIIPNFVMASRIRGALSVAKRLEGKFARRGDLVDAELRAAFLPGPTFDDLAADQKEMVGRCRDLEVGHAQDEDWSSLTSSSAFVEMWMKHTPARRGERSIAIGRAKVIIDSSPRDVAAWYFHYCSRERSRISVEKGDPARIIVRENSNHDVVVASIKKGTLIFHDREWVARNLTFVDGEGNFFWAAESVPDLVDYGTKFNTRRGQTIAFMRIEPIPGVARQCTVTLVQKIDAGGRIPAWIMDLRVAKNLLSVGDMRDVFARDDAIDADDRDALARVMIDVPQVYTPQEESLMEQIKTKLGALDEDGKFKQLVSPDHHTKMYWSNDRNHGGVGKSTMIADASLEDCGGWLTNLMSRENLRVYGMKGGIERSLKVLNSHSNLYRVVYSGGFGGVKPREWVQTRIWRRESGGSILEFFAESTEHPDFPVRDKYVRALSTVWYTCEKLDEIESTPQTRVTLLQRIDLSGALPVRIVDGISASALGIVSTIRRSFDKSLEVDEKTRAKIVNMIKGHSAAYSKVENDCIDGPLANFAMFQGEKTKELTLPSRSTLAKVAFKIGDSHAWGWSFTVVNASPEEILSSIWDTFKRSGMYADDLEKAVDEAPNDHNQLLYVKKLTPSVLENRDFYSRSIWRKESDGVFVFISTAEEGNLRPHLPGVVRGKYPSAMRLTRLNDSETKIEYVIHPDFGGNVPTWAMNFYIGVNLSYVSEIREMFQSFRGLEVWGEGDGKAVAEVMLTKTMEEKQHSKDESEVGARMRELFKKYKGLKEISTKYDFMEGMLARVVENRLRTAGDVSTRLTNLSKMEGRKIGAGLAASLASNLTAETAVDEWIGKYPALQQLDRVEVWFRPMMNTVALRLLGEVSWGLKFRVVSGAGLSMLDMVSDISVIVLYLDSPGQKAYGMLLLWMLVSCVLMQLALVYFQNRANKKKLVMEGLVVLTGLKPGKLSLRC
jgi:hypothetical protein